MEVTPEMRAFLWMLMSRLIHQEKIIELLASSDNVPSSPFLVKFSKLPEEEKTKIMLLAEKMLDMYSITIAPEPEEVEKKAPEIVTINNAITEKLEPNFPVFEQKTEDFSKIPIAS